MGHADPCTTRAYDRARQNLDRRPPYTLAANLHRSTAGGAAENDEHKSTR